jgi:hypothetical protein
MRWDGHEFWKVRARESAWLRVGALRRVFGVGGGEFFLVGELPFAVTHYGEGSVAKAGGAVATPLGPSSFMWYLSTRSGHRSRSPWRTLWVANPTRSKAWQIRPLAN